MHFLHRTCADSGTAARLSVRASHPHRHRLLHLVSPCEFMEHIAGVTGSSGSILFELAVLFSRELIVSRHSLPLVGISHGAVGDVQYRCFHRSSSS